MPYVSERLVQADQWKTASNWIARVMLRGLGPFRARRICDEHRPAWTLHAKWGDRLVFGSVREPCEWLCSYYDHCLTHGLDHVIRQIGAGSTDFAAYVKGACEPLDHWPGMAPKVEGGRTPAGPLWSYMVRYFYMLPDVDEWAVDVLVDAAQAREAMTLLGLPSALDRKNVSDPKRVESREARMTPALRRRVYKASGDLAGELGYTGAFEPACAPLVRLERYSYHTPPRVLVSVGVQPWH